MTERFTFGIPLVARAAADDWGLVDDLLALTLGSVLAQGDGDFAVMLAGHDRPPAWKRLAAGDPRFAFLAADWPPEAPSAANDDGGRKKWLVKQAVREEGGGLLMFLDADDWVDRDLVRAARASIAPADVGGLIGEGVAVDVASGRAARFPVSADFPAAFHELCGSSTVGRVEPASGDAVRRDPHAVLGSHHEWAENAARDGHRLARLDVRGAYLVGTGESHSEKQGPYAAWRRAFARAVRDAGEPLDAVEYARFGVAPEALARLASRSISA